MAQAVIDVTDVWSGRVLGRVGTAEDVAGAVARARAALEGAPWPAYARAALLDRAAEALAGEAEAFAQGLVAEVGKPLRAARGEVERAVSTLRFSAAAARTLPGEGIPMDAAAAGVGKLAFTLREPVGVIAAVTPFNFPLNLVLHKVGPALAAGCPVVLKPAEKAPLTAERLAALLRSVGLPDGWLEVVHGYGAEVVPPLVTHPDVSLVSFTGSGRVAAALQRLAPDKPLLTELGGSAPMLVEADADLDRAARAAVAGGFGFAGQSCISVQRVYAARPVFETLCARIVAGALALVVGDPSDAATDLGPLIRASEADRVRAWVDEAVARGGRLLMGGEWREGAGGPAGATATHPGLVRPVVLTDVPHDAAVVCEEVFGPVVVVDAYDTLAEGIARANATPYGLNAAIFTRDIGAALIAARGLRAGAVLVNESPTFRADHMPYGGVGASGNTREGPAWAARAFTREKLVVLEG